MTLTFPSREGESKVPPGAREDQVRARQRSCQPGTLLVQALQPSFEAGVILAPTVQMGTLRYHKARQLACSPSQSWEGVEPGFEVRLPSSRGQARDLTGTM